MRIAVGSDHAGYPLKELLAAHLVEAGHEVDNHWTDSEVEVDSPEFGAAVGLAVIEGRAELGLCACGTGLGISIAAKKVHGVRAPSSTTSPRRAWRVPTSMPTWCAWEGGSSDEIANDAIDTFLSAAPEGGRHELRIKEIAGLDAR